MRWVEVRRHAPSGDDKHLTAEGREVVRRVRASLQPRYDALVVSPLVRSAETLEAMGFSGWTVDPGFDEMPESVRMFMPQAKAIAAEQSCQLLEAMVQVPQIWDLLRSVGEQVLEGVRRVAGTLPEEGRALVISHGGSIEPAALLVMGGEMRLERIGGSLAGCEGALFAVEGDRVVGVEILRIPA